MAVQPPVFPVMLPAFRSFLKCLILHVPLLSLLFINFRNVSWAPPPTRCWTGWEQGRDQFSLGSCECFLFLSPARLDSHLSITVSEPGLWHYRRDESRAGQEGGYPHFPC